MYGTATAAHVAQRYRACTPSGHAVGGVRGWFGDPSGVEDRFHLRLAQPANFQRALKLGPTRPVTDTRGHVTDRRDGKRALVLCPTRPVTDTSLDITNRRCCECAGVHTRAERDARLYVGLGRVVAAGTERAGVVPIIIVDARFYVSLGGVIWNLENVRIARRVVPLQS